MAKRIEYRIFKTEVRSAKDGKPQIEGYAAVFNTQTDLGYVRESIAPGAFKDAIAEKQDVRCLFNHQPDHVLGRTKSGTLSLEEDNTGLKFRCDMPDTQMGKDVHSMIKRGDVDQCSFGFIVRDEEVNYDNADYVVRTIKKCDLFDVSPVTFPAYPTTSVEARSNAAILKTFKRDDDPNGTNDPDGDEMPHKGDDDEEKECACRCRACYSAECEECEMHMESCGDPETCAHRMFRDADGDDDGDEPDDDEKKSLRAKKSGKKTKKVAGEDLGPGAFAYVGDPNDTSTWKLPIKFSTEEKTKSHIQNALARFNQTQGIPASEKPKVLAKIKAAAKAHGIHVAGEEEKSANLTPEQAKARANAVLISTSV